jgi:hypothetical protein
LSISANCKAFSMDLVHKLKTVKIEQVVKPISNWAMSSCVAIEKITAKPKNAIFSQFSRIQNYDFSSPLTVS